MNPFERLASGRARSAALITALALALLFVLQQVGIAVINGDLGTALVVIALFDATMWIWVLAYAALIVDLPADGRVVATRWSVARAAATLAAIAPAALILSQLINSDVLALIAYPIVLGAMGVSLLAVDLTTQQTGIVSGGVASIGLVTGIAFVAAAVGYGVGAYVESPLATIGVSALLGGQILYVVWASWIGRRLRRAQSAES